MKTKEELQSEIYEQILEIKRVMKGQFASVESDATNRLAIANLYIALSNLIK